MVCLFESSTCFEQLCAHPEEDNRINTTSGIITLSGRPVYRTATSTERRRSVVAALRFIPLRIYQAHFRNTPLLWHFFDIRIISVRA